MASINGTSGNDTLTGTSGNDLIFGDFGDDILNGGGGEDKFVFNNVNDFFLIGSDMYVYSTDGFDIIKNFSGKIINIAPVNDSYTPHSAITPSVASSSSYAWLNSNSNIR